MEDKTIIGCVGIGALAAISIIALTQGIDSTLLASIAGTIGTIIGYFFGKKASE